MDEEKEEEEVYISLKRKEIQREGGKWNVNATSLNNVEPRAEHLSLGKHFFFSY